MAPEERIVILGGGFAGRYAAEQLGRSLPAQHRITVIERENHMLYTPMLTEVAGGSVPLDAVAVPAHSLPGRVSYIQAEIVSVDIAGKQITLSQGPVVTATHLVLALGSTTSYHGIDGAEQNSLSMKTLANAAAAAQRIDTMVRDAQALPPGDPARRNKLTLVVAGGGYTGVETMAALNTRLRKAAESKGIPSGEITAVLVETSPRLMSEMPEKLAEYARRQLEADHIRVLTGTGVKTVTASAITLSNGEMICPGLLVWDTGVEPSPLIQQMDVPRGKHHGVVTDSSFRVVDRPGVWAIGDCAEIPKPDGKGTYAPTAQNAVREGSQLAKNIAAVIAGKSPQPFHYKQIGQLALISEHDAVAYVFGIQLHGLLAWAMWWVIYTAKLPGIATRARVVSAFLTGS